MRLSLTLFGVTLALSLGVEDPSSPADGGPSFRATPGDLYDSSPLPSFPLGFTAPSMVDPFEGWQ